MMPGLDCQSNRRVEAASLPLGEVHVWRADLNVPPELLKWLAQMLSPDEQARAARFRLVRDQQHFTAGRALLRVILAGYLARDPRQVQFVYGAHGKPALTDDLGGRLIRFNLAHSASSLLIVVARAREVGIDIEHIRPMSSDRHFATQVFSSRELAALKGMSIEAQQENLIRCWVRK